VAGFMALYLTLLVAFIVYVVRAVKRGPEADDPALDDVHDEDLDDADVDDLDDGQLDAADVDPARGVRP
jgi:hypothetical protein